MKFYRTFFAMIAFAAIFPASVYSYKVEKPEELPKTPPVEDVFRDENAPKEATLISVGEEGASKLAIAGETIYLAQTFLMRPGYRLKEKMYGLMPGSLGIPFRFWINAGDLFFRSADTKYIYYSPKAGNAGASFPGLGEVVKGNDTAGIRVNKKNRRVEWFVDNTDYNQVRGHTIWHRGVSGGEAKNIISVKEGLPFRVIGMKKIVYEGFYDGAFVFTLIRASQEEGRTEKEIRFSPRKDGEATAFLGGVGLRCRLKEDSGLSYELTRISEH